MSQPPPLPPPLQSMPSLSTLSIPTSGTSASSLQRHFSVTTLRSLSRRQSYVVVLDFAALVLRWHKLRKGCEVKRTFAFQSAIKLEKNSKDPLCLTIMFAEAGHAVPVHDLQQQQLPTPTAGAPSASSSQGNVWQKVVFFASSEDRELFCNLVHAAIVSGEKAVRLYQQLSLQPPPSPSSSPASAAPALSPALQSLVGVDFCSFLIAYCAAQNHLDHTAIALANQQSSSSSSSTAPTAAALSINTTQLDPPSRPNSDSRHARRPSESSVALTDHLLAVNVGAGGSGIGSSQQPSMQQMFGFRLLDGELIALQAAHTTRLDVTGSSMNVVDGRDGGGSGSVSGSRPTSPSHGGANGGGGGLGASTVSSSRGNLFLTNYRIIYRDYHSPSTSSAPSASASSYPTTSTLPAAFAASSHSSSSDAEVPLACIHRVIRPSAASCAITLLTKDNRRLEFSFDASVEWVEGLTRRVIEAAFGGVKGMFAFEHGRVRGRKRKQVEQELSEEADDDGYGEDEVDGWSLYSPVREYARLGLLSSPSFRLSTHNSSFALCPSYPPSFIVPSIMSDADLLSVASHRSQQRLPATVYLHPITSATLSRSSQPLSGVRGRRNELDEAMLAVLRKANKSNSSQFVIVDARPYKAAMGNAVMGKGYENVAHYTGTKIEFCNIDNIHQVRGAMERLNALCSPTTSSASVASSTASSAGAGPSESAEDSWLSDLGRTQWLHWIRLVLAASVRVATLLSVDAVSVLVHCSDGWDRTAQLTSLTLLLLDGYHRTMSGFAVLVEKEWLSFGHRFSERHGQGNGEYDHTQRAPIFLQWLDCVWQVMRQHPTQFEFNELWLVDLYDGMLSGRFGSFLFDCQREREEARLRSSTESVWSWMMSGKQRLRYINSLYQPTHSAPAAAAASSSSASSSVSLSGSTAQHHPDLIDALVASSAAAGSTSYGHSSSITSSLAASTLSYCIPTVSAKRILLWERFHLRWDRHAPPTALTSALTAEQQLAAAAAAVGGKERRIVRKYHTMRSRLEQAGIDVAALDLSDASDDDQEGGNATQLTERRSATAELVARPSTADSAGRVKGSVSRPAGGGAAARVAAKRAAAFTVSPHAFARASAAGQLTNVAVLTADGNSSTGMREEAKWAEQSSDNSSGDKTDGTVPSTAATATATAATT